MKHTNHQLPFQQFSAFCYLEVSELQTQFGQLKLSLVENALYFACVH